MKIPTPDPLRFLSATVPAILLALAWGDGLRAQEDGPATTQVTRAYQLKDVLISANNYGFDGVQLPGRAAESGFRPLSFPGGGGFGGGGGGGLGGGGGGGGIFSIPDPLIHNTAFQQAGGGPNRGGGGSAGGGDGGFKGAGFDPDSEQPVTLDDIQAVLADLLAGEEAWNGNMQQLGTALIITTTPEIHRLVEQHLDMIRETVSGTSRSVTISITWLQIDHEQYDSLGAKTENGVVVVDREKLQAVAREDGASGTITCFDGQTVHLASGHMKNRIRSVSPVVGSHELTTTPQRLVAAGGGTLSQLVSSRNTSPVSQADGDRVPGNVGYNPVTETINLGAVLQVTPVTIPESNAMLLDVRSNIVLPMNLPEDARSINFMDVVNLDRLHVRSQQFRTSLRVPLNQPVVVGGSAVQVGAASSLYVVMEVSTGSDR